MSRFLCSLGHFNIYFFDFKCRLQFTGDSQIVLLLTFVHELCNKLFYCRGKSLNSLCISVTRTCSGGRNFFCEEMALRTASEHRTVLGHIKLLVRSGGGGQQKHINHIQDKSLLSSAAAPLPSQRLLLPHLLDVPCDQNLNNFFLLYAT